MAGAGMAVWIACAVSTRPAPVRSLAAARACEPSHTHAKCTCKFLRKESRAEHSVPDEMAVILIVSAVLHTTALTGNACAWNIVTGAGLHVCKHVYLLPGGKWPNRQRGTACCLPPFLPLQCFPLAASSLSAFLCLISSFMQSTHLPHGRVDGVCGLHSTGPGSIPSRGACMLTEPDACEIYV